MGLARFLGSIWAGFWFGALGENSPYWLGAVLIAAGTIFCWRQITQSQFSEVMRRRRQRKLIYLFELIDQC